MALKLLPSVASPTLGGSGTIVSKNDQLPSALVATAVVGTRVVSAPKMSTTLNMTSTELATSASPSSKVRRYPLRRMSLPAQARKQLEY